MIFIKGGKKKQRDLAENAACFAINKLFPKFRKYSILIRLNKLTWAIWPQPGKMLSWAFLMACFPPTNVISVNIIIIQV